MIDNIESDSSINPCIAWATFVQSTRTLEYSWKPSTPYSIGIHLIALAEYSQMGTHLPGFQIFSVFLNHFVLGKLATSSIRVKAIYYLKNILT